MATGSGKTLLMGALILYLHMYERFKDFLIITPTSEIYKKTINNFDMMSNKCVFSNSMIHKYNVITGDNFTDKSSNYDEDMDFTIHIFNIQKFFERTTGELKLDKEWEESFWKDGLGNIISFREYLKRNQLVIITDEAHHYQKFKIQGKNQTSGNVIVSLEPELVLEFTATAITEEQSQDRRAQKIIYNYHINKFISDGYGKKVRAYGYSGFVDKAKGDLITMDDKKKFLVSYLIHLVKKEALKEINFKPILLIRARSITHANNLHIWLKQKIIEENQLIENIYNEIVKGEKFVITALINRFISLENFQNRVGKIPDINFTYHNENENEKEILDKVNNIETNRQEVLIQIKKLEEGWDIQNPFTILILNISRGKIKIYIKQLIGRGIRLFREKRIHDGLTGFLRNQQEILHVVCEKGGNFENFVKDVRNELGLSKSSFTSELFVEQKRNKTIAKSEKFNDLILPSIKITSKSKIKATELLNEISFNNLKLDLFIEKNTYVEKGKTFWNITEIGSGIEENITEGTLLKIEDAKYKIDTLKFREIELNDLILNIISTQSLLPSHPSIKNKLKGLLYKINDMEINYIIKHNESRIFYVEKLKQLILNHLKEVFDNYFETSVKIQKRTLKEIFQEENVTIEKTSENGVILNIKHKENINPDKEDSVHILITNFQKAYYHFNWFESSHEFKLAYQLDLLDDVEFWIRNKRSFYQEYGIGNKYYPDFIVKFGSDLFIIEVKGAYYSQKTKTKKEIEILNKLRKRGYKTLYLLDLTIDKKIYRKAKTFKNIIKCDDLPNTSN